MWKKSNNIWSKNINEQNIDKFLEYSEKLKSYSKSLKASSYSVTHTLGDIYNILNYKHAFWIMITEEVEGDSLIVGDIEYEKDVLYNLAKDMDIQEILNYDDLRVAISENKIKCANSNLFKNDINVDWFKSYNPATDSTTGYEFLVISSDYDRTDITSTFQDSQEDYGYSIRNYFNSDKVIEKLLKNFHLVDFASTQQIDIFDADGSLKFYPILEIDSTKLLDGNTVLLKDQNDASENGVYVYKNQKIEKDSSFDSVEDYYMFSAYIKEGVENKEKEFFLDREDDGHFPTLNDEKYFIEGDNYVIRNRISYRLIKNHLFKDGKYFTERKPNLNDFPTLDFTESVFVNNNEYVIDLLKNSLVKKGSTEDVLYTLEGVKFLKPLKIVGNTIYCLGVLNNDYVLYSFIDGGTDFTLEATFNETITNFDVVDDFIYAINDNNEIVEYNISSDVIDNRTTIKDDAIDIKVLNIGSDRFYFYTNNKGVYVNYLDKNFVIENTHQPRNLRIEVISQNIGGTMKDLIYLFYLNNGEIIQRSVVANELKTVIAWEKGYEYKIDFFSKEDVGDWKIENNNLFLKGYNIPNASTEVELNEIPKINNIDGRYYDGIDDFSTMDNVTIEKIKSGNGSFSIEFKINPESIKINTPVFYFGENTEIIEYDFSSTTYNYQTPPKNYISFYLSDSNLLPYMLLVENGKEIKIRSNTILSENEEVMVSFTYNYNENKATSNLYFDGVKVGNYVDQRNISTSSSANTPLNTNNIPFTNNFIGKSEINNNPSYRGIVKEFRIWNRDLNQAQVSARKDKEISDFDVIIDNLVTYYKLNDINSIHIDGRSSRTSLFKGGLVSDSLLSELVDIKQVQLSDSYSYLLSEDSVYRISLRTENIEKIIQGTDLKSIYVENNILFYLKGDSIFKFNDSDLSSDSISFTLDGSKNIIDLFVIYSNDVYNTYIYYDDGTITDESNTVIYNNSTFNLKTIYGRYQEGNLKIYILDDNNKVNLISNDINGGFDYIASYPQLDKLKLEIDGDFYEIVDNRIYKNFEDLDSSNKYWNLKSKVITSLDRENEKLYASVITEDNILELWQYNTVTNKYCRMMQEDNTSLISSEYATIEIFEKNGLHYLLILDSFNKKIYGHSIDKGNKLSYGTIPFEFSYETELEAKYLNYYSADKFVIYGDKEGDNYLFTFTNINTDYSLWFKSLTYTEKTDGLVVGESGLVFKDVDFDNWTLEWNNILYKEDFDAVEVNIESKTQNGYSYKSWGGVIWLIGKSGRVLRSLDNGNNWEALQTNVDSDLTSISFFNKKDGFIVGKNNTVLYTTSGGDTFTQLQIPSNLGMVNWNKVLFYDSNKVIIVGDNGKIIHLSYQKTGWEYDTVLNQVELTTIEKQILPESLDNFISLNFIKEFESDYYLQNINDISYLGNNEFLIVGDRDLILNLKLDFKKDFILPNSNFLRTERGLNWNVVKPFIDQENNLKKAFLLSGKEIYTVVYDRYKENEKSNIHSVDSELFSRVEEDLENLIHWDSNYLIYVGKRVTVGRTKISFDEPSGFVNTTTVEKENNIVENETVQYQDLNQYFAPKMLFLDYYIARKINLHVDENNFEIPKAYVPKNIFECYKFNTGEYLEMKDYGVVGNQNNFLSIQDYHYVNRRVLDGSKVNGTMMPWRRYNKKIEAVGNTDYDSRYVTKLSNDNTESLFYRLETEEISNPFTYDSSTTFEKSLATKIFFNDLDFSAQANDVVKTVFLEKDKTLEIQKGDTLWLNIESPTSSIFDYGESGVVQENGIVTFKESEIVLALNNDEQLNTVQIAENEIKPTCRNFINSLLKNRCLPVVSDSDITVSLNIVRYESNSIVKENIRGVEQSITLFDVFTPEMSKELNQCDLRLRNLNYFNGDLAHLQLVFNQGLMGVAYEMDIYSDENDIIINGIVDDETKYYNLESIVKINLLDSSDNDVVSNYNLEYSEDVVYGPNYSLLNFLKPIDPVFNESYEFDLPNYNFEYSDIFKDINGEYTELTITDNKIYAGQDLYSFQEFKTGQYVDITRGGETAKRVFIKSVEETNYNQFKSIKRYILTTDQELDSILSDDSTTSINIRVRNTLKEISDDLEFTDNLMHPLPKGDANSVEFYNKAYFTQLKTSSIYSKMIMNDPNIRKHISAVAFLDDDNDWSISVINWNNDANFDYRPIDLFELGIDRELKKAITIDIDNLRFENDKMSLVNIDSEEFNFRLIDGMTLNKLETDYHWIMNADIKDAIIGEDEKGLVWYQGIWRSGLWEGFTWYSGTIYDIEWLEGDFYSYRVTNKSNDIVVDTSVSDSQYSTWFDGIWYSGDFHNGSWYNGNWKSGVRYDGEWFDGVWESGLWTQGRWRGGDWFNGTWLEGEFSQDNAISTWYDGQWLGGDFENGTWKNGVWDETDRLKSRFGTKSSILKTAVWEYGLWKNGEFHSGLNIGSNGETLPSERYNTSMWLNGIWEKGDFFGGTWFNGIFKNGLWHNGYWRSTLEIKEIRINNDSNFIVEFKDKHYFKIINGAENYFVIFGKPEIVEGELHISTEFLGYNMQPQKHIILNILDDYRVMLRSEAEFSQEYTDQIVEEEENDCIPCSDYTQFGVTESRTIKVDFDFYDNKPLTASHWVNGTWLGGIWEQGWFNNGSWKGGMWLDGVFENGLFGE